jgi:hypothetical protein
LIITGRKIFLKNNPDMDLGERKKKILFVNKFGATSNAITGQTAKELADYLHEQGCEVCFLCIGAVYRATNKQAAVNTPYRIKAIRDFYNGDSASLRLLMSFVDGFRLFIHSLFIKSDAVIIMTEPPLLFFWFQLFRVLLKRQILYWTMDVYPDAFVAARFVSAKNLFYRFFKRIVYRKPPDLLIALGNEQRNYLEKNFKKELAYAIIPCGIIEKKILAGTGDSGGSSKILFGYGGNIGAAHDAGFLIEFVRQLDPAKHEIILSVYGTKAAAVKEKIGNCEAVQARTFLSHDDIAAIDINIASLLTEWNHISVPSKAVTAICCGSTLLLNTPKAADAWLMFEQASWIIEPGNDYAASVKEFLQNLSRKNIVEKRIHAAGIASYWVNEKRKAYKKVLSVITGA